MNLPDLPTPIHNPGEEVGVGESRVVSPIANATTAPEPPHRKFEPDGGDTILGIGKATTEVERNLQLINKFGMLNVFAAVILAAAGIGMTVLWSANQSNVALAIRLLVDQNEGNQKDFKERDKLTREDAREQAKQHREDRTKLWEAQRDLAQAIREQTKSAEDTHATMKKTLEVMSIHATALEKILANKKS